jgi:hypothetical protein
MNTARSPLPWHFTPTLIIVSGSLVAMVNFGVRSSFGLFTGPISEAHLWPREVFSFGLALQNLLWGTAFGFIWVVVGDEPGLAGRLAQQGAIGAYRELPLNPSIAGCFALADAKIAAYTGLQ